MTALAMMALAIGVLVYLLDGPAGSAHLLTWPGRAVAVPAEPFFGAAGAWLPSLLHAYAFGVMTCLALPASTLNAPSACGFWAAVDTVFEFGQHPSVAPRLVQAIGQRFDGIPVLDQFGRYLADGTFDPADAAAGLAGRRLHLPPSRQRGLCERRLDFISGNCRRRHDNS